MVELLGKTGFHIPISPVLIFGAMAVLFIAWGVFSWVIRYHWSSYGTGKLEVMTMTFFYFIGSALLLGLMTIFAFMYYFSS